MMTQLWDDKRILEWLGPDEAAPGWYGALRGMQEVRDEYEAEIERLRAQLAATWQPAEGVDAYSEGDYVLSLLKDGRLLVAYQRGKRDIRNVGMELPDDVRLCRRAAPDPLAQPDPIAHLVPPASEWPDDAVAWMVDGCNCPRWLKYNAWATQFWLDFAGAADAFVDVGSIAARDTLRLRPHEVTP